MKRIFYIIVGISIYLFTLSNNFVFAEGKGAPTGLLDGVKSTADKAASERIREGDLHLGDIPNVIQGLINIFIGLAGTIAVIFVIYGGYRLLFGSLKGDHTKGRETIVMALTGFVIAILAWFIVKLIFNNLVNEESAKNLEIFTEVSYLLV